MSIVEIHGKKVHIEDNSHSAHFAAKYLTENKDNADDLFKAANAAYRNNETGAHFTVPQAHTSEDQGVIHHVTMIEHSDGTYTLQKRHGY
jgi:seryl-tRNA(Sec) selenium transferase